MTRIHPNNVSHEEIRILGVCNGHISFFAILCSARSAVLLILRLGPESHPS